MSPFRPVFIGGAGRSGTTLLVDLLGTHADLSPVYETDLVVQLATALFSGRGITPQRIREVVDQWTAPLPLRPHNKRAHERYLHGPHHVLFDRAFALDRTEVLLAELPSDGAGAFRRWVESLFARHAELDGKPYWVNKTPLYVQILPALRALWPDLLFLHCVRDGRDATASALTRPWGPPGWEAGADWWRKNVEPGREFEARHPKAALVVRYEDVLAEPEAALEPILAALGLAGAAETVDRYRAAGGSLDPSRAGGWRSADPGEVAKFEARAGDLLDALGYPVGATARAG